LIALDSIVENITQQGKREDPLTAQEAEERKQKDKKQKDELENILILIKILW
jgi:hypothetical protein